MTDELPFRLLFELSNDAIFVVDGVTGRILEANEHAALYTERPIKSLRDVSFKNLFHDVSPLVGKKAEAHNSGLTSHDVFLKGRTERPHLPCKMKVREATLKGTPVEIYVLRDISVPDGVLENLYLKTEAIAAVGSGGTLARDSAPSLINLNPGFEKLPGYSAVASATENDRDHIFIKDGSCCWLVEYDNLRLLESEDNFVRFYFEDQKPLVHRTLNYLEERLPTRKFVRANRRQIINLKWIKGIQSWFNGGFLVTLKDGEKVQMSRRSAQFFKEKMGV